MYITFKVKNDPRMTGSFDDLFDTGSTVYTARTKPKTFTKVIAPSDHHRANYKVEAMERTLWDFVRKIPPHLDPIEHYHAFTIPKASGGFRTIHAPDPELKYLQSTLKHIFEYDFKCLAHNNAYAYVKNRCTRDAIEMHQANQSKWFLKVDLKDFFPSCSFDFVFNQLMKLFPFAQFSTAARHNLYKALELCFLNDGLPQGTPMSPILTNLIMIPIDEIIHRWFVNFENQSYVYTRYADDIIISSKYHFKPDKIENELEQIVAPFKINKAKTRYGSSSGRNWNLGLMLNKDNNITIGWKNKEKFRAMLQNFCNAPTFVDKEHVQHILGLISYYKMIEPEYVQQILDKYNQKHSRDIVKSLKLLLKNL